MNKELSVGDFIICDWVRGGTTIYTLKKQYQILSVSDGGFEHTYIVRNNEETLFEVYSQEVDGGNNVAAYTMATFRSVKNMTKEELFEFMLSH